MGILISKKEQSLLKAKQIKQDLYRQVYAKEQKYHHIFSTISRQKKLQILTSDATQLVQMMDQGQATSVQILMCFIQRTISVGLSHNYVIDELFEDALVRAMECDIIRMENPEKKSWNYGMNQEESFPPFFGVPCSVKQTVLMKGRQTYGGFVSKLNIIPQEQTAYMTLIRNMGLIPFVRSNVPQACKTIETNNNMFGYCLNYRNKNRSCGGSSGGQGGLVGSHCSPIGIGSDIGGSLRVPAEFNGLFTIKPSLRNDRDANAYYGKYPGGCTVKGQLGPLTKSVRDLVKYCDFVFDKKNYEGIDRKKIDPHLNLVSLDHNLLQAKPKFKIGMINRLDTLKCSPSHQKALSIVSKKLSELGHSVVNTKLQRFEQFYFFMIALFSCGSDMSVMDEIRQNEPLIKQYKLFELLSKIPWIVKKVLIWLIQKKEPRLAKILSLSKPMNCRQVMEMIYDIQVKKAKDLLGFFVDNQFDVLIMPGFALPAPKLGEVANLQYCLAFQSGWNVVQYPAGNLPVKLVEADETACFQDEYCDSITKNMRKNILGSQGLPVGVQVISLPKNEQKILYIMSQLQKEIKFNQTYPLQLRI